MFDKANSTLKRKYKNIKNCSKLHWKEHLLVISTTHFFASTEKQDISPLQVCSCSCSWWGCGHGAVGRGRATSR